VPLPGPQDRPTDGTNVETADDPASGGGAEAEADEVRRQDPDAPALGAVDDNDEVNDLPEPSEPG
jgi:hypothetical protein